MEFTVSKTDLVRELSLSQGVVEKKTTMSSGPEIVSATRHFCSAEMRDDVQSFFGEHKVSAAERALKQSFEDISTCAKTRTRLETELGGWLQQHGARSGN